MGGLFGKKKNNKKEEEGESGNRGGLRLAQSNSLPRNNNNNQRLPPLHELLESKRYNTWEANKPKPVKNGSYDQKEKEKISTQNSTQESNDIPKSDKKPKVPPRRRKNRPANLIDSSNNSSDTQKTLGILNNQMHKQWNVGTSEVSISPKSPIPHSQFEQIDYSILYELQIAGTVSMVSIHEYIPINPDELFVAAFDKLDVSETILRGESEFVWATHHETKKEGFVPKMFLRKDGTNEALQGFTPWTRQQAEAKIQKGTFIIRNSSGSQANHRFSITTWRNYSPKFQHHKIFVINDSPNKNNRPPRSVRYCYQSKDKLVKFESILDLIKHLQNDYHLEVLACEPPTPPLRKITSKVLFGSKCGDLGSGNFGEVFKVEIKRMDNCTIPYAVKILKSNMKNGANKIDVSNEYIKKKKEMEEEINTMKYVSSMKNMLNDHSESMVRLVYATECCESMVLELCNLGDAKKLKEEIKMENKGTIPASEVLDFAIQISNACCFLTRIKISHNDWACRNVLVTSGGKRCRYNYKISDFGLATYVENNDPLLDSPILNEYKRKIKRFRDIAYGNLPLKWSPPEITRWEDCDETCNTWSSCITIMEFADIHKSPWPELKINILNHYKYILDNPDDTFSTEYKPRPFFMDQALFDIVKQGVRHKKYRLKADEIYNKLICYE